MTAIATTFYERIISKAPAPLLRQWNGYPGPEWIFERFRSLWDADIGSTIVCVEVPKKRLRDEIKKRGAFFSAPGAPDIQATPQQCQGALFSISGVSFLL
ncbi:MAG: hypothetical protein C0402_14755 [Thermodesulfovibrio sp.]|nr:hypothetical protein [Thermodesulfovibrio sp.]